MSAPANWITDAQPVWTPLEQWTPAEWAERIGELNTAAYMALAAALQQQQDSDGSETEGSAA